MALSAAHTTYTSNDCSPLPSALRHLAIAHNQGHDDETQYHLHSCGRHGIRGHACNIPIRRFQRRIWTVWLRRGCASPMRTQTSSVCTPSRYSILTGRYCWRTPLKKGVLWPFDPPLVETRPADGGGVVARHGYRTACIGKWHLGWTWRHATGAPAHQGLGLGEYQAELRRARELAAIDYSKPMRGGPIDAASRAISAWMCELSAVCVVRAGSSYGDADAGQIEDLYGLPGQVVPDGDTSNAAGIQRARCSTSRNPVLTRSSCISP